jgi:hypothetical protein
MKETHPGAVSPLSRPNQLLRYLFVSASLVGILQAKDESPIPHSRPASRYAAMKQQSPFALATPVEPTAPPQASFAANWFVSGIARLGDVDYVTIKARDLSSEFSLYGHDANSQNGVALASIEWSDKIGKSAVIIKKGTETAKLEFNEAEMNGPPQITTAKGTPAGGPKKGTPTAADGLKAALQPLPPYSAGRPSTPIPGNPGATPASRLPPTGQPPAAGNPQQGQDRRRIRIINAPQ